MNSSKRSFLERVESKVGDFVGFAIDVNWSLRGPWKQMASNEKWGLKIILTLAGCFLITGILGKFLRPDLPNSGHLYPGIFGAGFMLILTVVLFIGAANPDPKNRKSTH